MPLLAQKVRQNGHLVSGTCVRLKLEFLLLTRLMLIFIEQISAKSRGIFIFLFEEQYLRNIAENRKIKRAANYWGDANKN